MTTLTIIVARASNNVIGFRNNLPWDLPADMKHFIKETTGKAIVMGRKTFESIGRPLPNRFNIVLTKQQGEIEGVKKCHNLAEAVDAASKAGYDELIVIGGQGLYQTAMPWVTKLIVTEIHKEYVGDAFFPNLPLEDWQEQFRSDVTTKDAATMEDIGLSFVTYVRPGGLYKPDLNEPADILMHMSMNSARWRMQRRKLVAVTTAGGKPDAYASHFLDKETVEKLGLGGGLALTSSCLTEEGAKKLAQQRELLISPLRDLSSKIRPHPFFIDSISFHRGVGDIPKTMSPGSPVTVPRPTSIDQKVTYKDPIDGQIKTIEPDNKD